MALELLKIEKLYGSLWSSCDKQKANEAIASKVISILLLILIMQIGELNRIEKMRKLNYSLQQIHPHFEEISWPVRLCLLLNYL